MDGLAVSMSPSPFGPISVRAARAYCLRVLYHDRRVNSKLNPYFISVLVKYTPTLIGSWKATRLSICRKSWRGSLRIEPEFRDEANPKNRCR